MGSRLVFTPAARNDLRDIQAYIARESGSRDIAGRFTGRLLARCAKLAATPLMGRARPELREDLRSFPFKDYVIFYQVAGNTVRIVSVLHGHRDIESYPFPEDE